jgi:hypothetical protein
MGVCLIYQHSGRLKHEMQYCFGKLEKFQADKTMINKKAVLFEIYLVLLTLSMCFLVMGFYYFQQKQIQQSIILPNSLLALEESRQIFDIQEKNILIQSFKDAVAESSSSGDGFNLEFRDKFFMNILRPEQKSFRDFLFNSTFGDVSISQDARTNPGVQVYYLQQIYSIEKIYIPESVNYKFVVTRKPIGKFLFVKPDEKNKIGFSVRVDWSFGKEYDFGQNPPDVQPSAGEDLVETQEGNFILK